MSTRLSRLERITNLVLALLDASRPLSLREIGIAVAGYPTAPGALRQAFERDKRTLRDNGIPISVERIDGDDQVGYRILPEQYYLPDLGLTPEENAALAFALLAVRLEGGVGREVLHKLGGDGGPRSRPSRSCRRCRPSGSLQQAIRDRAPVTLRLSRAGRRVDGYGLVFRGGSWYFVGRDTAVGRDPGDCAGSGSTGSRTSRSPGSPGATNGRTASTPRPSCATCRSSRRRRPGRAGGDRGRDRRRRPRGRGRHRARRCRRGYARVGTTARCALRSPSATRRPSTRGCSGSATRSRCSPPRTAPRRHRAPRGRRPRRGDADDG